MILVVLFFFKESTDIKNNTQKGLSFANEQASLKAFVNNYRLDYTMWIHEIHVFELQLSWNN